MLPWSTVLPGLQCYLISSATLSLVEESASACSSGTVWRCLGWRGTTPAWGWSCSAQSPGRWCPGRGASPSWAGSPASSCRWAWERQPTTLVIDKYNILVTYCKPLMRSHYLFGAIFFVCYEILLVHIVKLCICNLRDCYTSHIKCHLKSHPEVTH